MSVLNGEQDVLHVGLADDDALARRALTALLGADPGIEVMWSVGEGSLVLDRVVTEPVDVLLLDMQMPGMDGLQVLAELQQRGQRLPVVMLTTFGTTERIVEALNRGAKGYFLKDDDPDLIATGLRSAVNGAYAFSPTASEQFLEAVRGMANQNSGATSEVNAPTPAAQTANLTGREEEVLRLLSQSLSNKQIAKELSVSEATVKTHVSVLIAKLGVPDRVGAAVWAYRNGLV